MARVSILSDREQATKCRVAQPCASTQREQPPRAAPERRGARCVLVAVHDDDRIELGAAVGLDAVLEVRRNLANVQSAYAGVGYGPAGLGLEEWPFRAASVKVRDDQCERRVITHPSHLVVMMLACTLPPFGVQLMIGVLM